MSIDFSNMSKKQLEQFAEDYYQKWLYAELYLNLLNRLKKDKSGKKSEKISTIQLALAIFDEDDGRISLTHNLYFTRTLERSESRFF